MSNASLMTLSVSQLRRAIDLREQIDALQAELNALVGGAAPAPATSAAPAARRRGGRRGGISAEGRARIAAAQRARWAKQKAGKPAAAAAKPAPKRKISAAGRARIAAAQRERWAKLKAAQQG